MELLVGCAEVPQSRRQRHCHRRGAL